MSEEQRLPIDKVEQLVDLLRESGVGEIQVRQGEMEITVKARPEAASQPPVSHATAQPAPAPEPELENPERNGLHAVHSPLVGTFYRASAPGEDVYVEVGDRVEAGQTLCIVEAMKLMNEIPADVSGEVVEILPDNASGVEYDEPLFYLRPGE
ncbi:acetyl-CoA carboxylase biotin carboxyl carrier protein [soil metagenome]|jgi:acetyl-CoA carboxylase biotin carboxyl carrier protein